MPFTEEKQAYVCLYKNHSGTIGYWEGWVEPNAMVVVRYAKALDGKPVIKQYLAEGKNLGRANETTPVEQGCLEIQSKARLKLDKGYVSKKSLAEEPVTNTLGQKLPMLATPIEKIKPEKIDWDSAYVQPKLDGHRALFKDGVLYSRQGKALDLPHIVEAIHAAGAQHLHLDGELYLHGKTLQDLSKLIKKQRPETLDLQYHVYDMVSDYTFSTRNGVLRDYLNEALGQTLKLVPTRQIYTPDELASYHAGFRCNGYEGSMLRFGYDRYQDGKRSRTLLKVKEFQDSEFTIVGVEEGKPYITEERTFQVPIWVCDAGNGKTFTVTAQGNMYEKHELWQIRQDFIGDMLTVKYHYMSADGIPQLPIALRFYETV